MKKGLGFVSVPGHLFSLQPGAAADSGLILLAGAIGPIDLRSGRIREAPLFPGFRGVAAEGLQIGTDPGGRIS